MLCRFPHRKLDALFDEMPMLEKKLLGATTQNLAAAQDQMLLLGRKTAREKVASFLDTLGRRLFTKGDRKLMFALPMSRSDIADFLGLTIETVSRTLTGLKREGLIALPDASHVAILRRRRWPASVKGPRTGSRAACSRRTNDCKRRQGPNPPCCRGDPGEQGS